MLPNNLSECNIPLNFQRDLKELFPDQFTQTLKQKDQSLFLYGEPGTGKTLRAIGTYLNHFRNSENIPKNYFQFINVSELLFKIRQTYSYPTKFNKELEMSYEEILLSQYRTPKYIFLDDLGVEKTTDWSLQTLYLIINFRYENMKNTIITSNYSPQELMKKMADERIISRIVSMCQVVKCTKQYRHVQACTGTKVKLK
jgi:DNA replication protein DnaC